MSIFEQINKVKTEAELFQLIEEQLLDIETPFSWSEMADKLEQEGDTEKANILRSAEKRLQEFK